MPEIRSQSVKLSDLLSELSDFVIGIIGIVGNSTIQIQNIGFPYRNYRILLSESLQMRSHSFNLSDLLSELSDSGIGIIGNDRFPIIQLHIIGFAIEVIDIVRNPTIQLQIIGFCYRKYRKLIPELLELPEIRSYSCKLSDFLIGSIIL